METKIINIPSKISNVIEWIDYFYILQKKYDSESAKNIWLLTWNKNGNNQFLDDITFKQFIAKNKINLFAGSTASKVIGIILGGLIISGLAFLFISYKTISFGINHKKEIFDFGMKVKGTADGLTNKLGGAMLGNKGQLISTVLNK